MAEKSGLRMQFQWSCSPSHCKCVTSRFRSLLMYSAAETKPGCLAKMSSDGPAIARICSLASGGMSATTIEVARLVDGSIVITYDSFWIIGGAVASPILDGDFSGQQWIEG